MTSRLPPPSRRARVRSRSSATTLAWGVASDAGRVRLVNEDAACTSAPVFAVADGMGGHEGGDIAAALIVGALASFDARHAIDSVALRSTIEASSRAIFQRSGAGERVMGTTLTGVALTNASAAAVTVFNVGDSRTYLLSNGTLRQITTDHSLVQELYDSRQITLDEVAQHRDRNVVTRAIGIDAHIEIDTIQYQLEVGQRWMMCSDGLTSELSESDLLAHLAVDDPQQAADRLVAATLAGEARDNVTVVILDIVELEELDDPDRTDPRTRSLASVPRESPEPDSPALITEVPAHLSGQPEDASQ